MTALAIRFKSFVRLGLIICFSWLVMTTPVHARGGCFASGTHILTTRGDITIEQLHVGDPVVGLNLENQQLETEHIGDIQVVEAPDYYVINDSITVTGFHPFYVQQEAGLRLVLVEDLSVGDQLIGEGEFSPIVRSIRHYEEPITVYNLLSVTPHHNFFAEGVLVHNKGGGGGGGRGGGGSGGYGGGGYGSSAPFTLKTISGLLIPFLILTASLLPVILWREIYNGVRFFGKDFSEDAGLIAFTQQVNPNFCNRYAAICSEDNEGWESHSLLQEIDTVAYSEVVEKVSLIDQVSQIFSRYQNDWTKKNFDAMADYTMPSFHEQQQSLFHKEFRDNFDIVYLPKIKDLVPIRAQQSDTDFVITVQLVTAAINFEVSSKGRVLSGKPESRTFTEYWDVAVDAQKTCRLLSIRSKHSG